MAMCEKCHKRIGQFYSFHYGAQFKQSHTFAVGSKYTTRTTYRELMIGEDRAPICDTCIRRRFSKQVILFTTIVGAIAVIVAAGSIWGGIALWTQRNYGYLWVGVCPALVLLVLGIMLISVASQRVQESEVG